MAACVIENTQLSSYQTRNLIHSYVQSNQMESRKKRPLTRNNTFTNNNELTKTIIDNSCSEQAGAITTTDNNQKCMGKKRP
jgi:hypothetical protein